MKILVENKHGATQSQLHVRGNVTKTLHLHWFKGENDFSCGSGCHRELQLHWKGCWICNVSGTLKNCSIPQMYFLALIPNAIILSTLYFNLSRFTFFMKYPSICHSPQCWKEHLPSWIPTVHKLNLSSIP